jgi:predicted alpha/beta-hydrolase family hydrolase
VLAGRRQADWYYLTWMAWPASAMEWPRRTAYHKALEDFRLEEISIRVSDASVVSGLLLVPDQARACYVLAHGAGAGMTHPFMAAVAAGLGQRGIATLRYQFPAMEKGLKRPDAPPVAHAAVRAAVAEALRLVPGSPLIAGGKSFGGRMTSQTQAEAPLPAVVGLAFLGFPLHPLKQPSEDRARHLSDVNIPMLFVQGTRDGLAEPRLLARVVARFGLLATLELVPNADHSFHVPARGGCTDEQVKNNILDRLADWIDRTIATGG